MTRDETVALFMECEAKRTEASAKALAEGKSEAEAYLIGQDAAKTHWNNWAESMLAQRKALEEAGTWSVQRNILDLYPVLEARNADTRVWTQKASCVLSNLYIEPKEWLLNQPGADASRYTVRGKTVINSNMMDFSGFIFPWHFDASFTLFIPELNFSDCAFLGQVFMYEAEFYNMVTFIRCTFSEGTRFNGTIFKSRATFDQSAFYFQSRFQSHIQKERSV